MKPWIKWISWAVVNIVNMAAWTYAAIYFGKWWIMLFCLLTGFTFESTSTSKKESRYES